MRVLTYALLATSGLICAFPFLWLLSSSLQTWRELESYTPRLLPAVPQWQNYPGVFRMVPFGRWMLNSLIVIGIALPGELITGTLAAYGFARFDFRGKTLWFILVLGTMLIPYYVTLIPRYLLFFHLKLVNTYVPLTIGSWLGGGAFGIFLLRQFIMAIPRDLDEAAVVDGAGPFRILAQILAPLMKPALSTLAILQFLSHWNSFFEPFIYLQKPLLFTAAIGLRYFATMPADTRIPLAHLLMASSTMMTVPVLIVFVAAQGYFVRGIVMTGLKV